MSLKHFPLLICLLVLDHASDYLVRDDLDHLGFEGTVTDTHGAALPAARITARQVHTGHTRSTQPNAEGRYRLSRLTPGVYLLTAESAGFRASAFEGLRGAAGTTIRRDFQLVPSPIEAGVTIDAATSSDQVDTSRTVIGATLGRVEIDELPTANRSALDLLFSLPGVVEPALTTSPLAEGDESDRFRSTPEETGNFALNGGTPFSNNLTIEGLDNNDDRAARERFLPSIDAVEEVQVIANQFSAEYGRASGGRVNVRLRSGGERYHARLFEYFRDARLNANSFHRNADPSRGFRLPFTEHNPGGTIGGPMIGDQTFFFAAYEFLKVSDHADIAALVPVASNSRFPLPQPNGTNLGSTSVDREGRPVTVNGGASVGLYDLSVATPRTSHSLQTRLDFKSGSRHSGFVLATMARMRDERSFPGGRRTLETMRASGRNSSSIAVSDVFVLAESTISETRLQLSRLSPVDQADSSNPVVLIEIDDPRNIPGSENALSRSGNLLAGSSNLSGVNRNEDRLQVQQVLTGMRRTHHLRGGVDAHLITSRYMDLEDTTGTFTFAGPADFLNGRPSRYRQRFKTTSGISNTYTGVYLQDGWRPRSNLTLSGGIRWDNETSLADHNNLGPRVALAWDPRGVGRMVVRSGFGLFYNRVLLRTLDDFSLTSGSLLIDTNLPSAKSLLVESEFPEILRAGDPRIAQMAIRESAFRRRLESSLRTPESYQAAVGFETALGRLWRLELSYVYNRGAHLWREININAPRIPDGFADFSAYLLSRDFDNRREVATGLRPITSTGNADFVRFDLSQVSSRMIEENAKRIVVFGLDNQSTSNSTSGLRAALATLRPLRPEPELDQVEELQARGNSYYHGLTVNLERSSSRGRVRFAYTLGRLIDDGVVNTSSPLVVGDFRRELAPSLLDARHRFVVNGTWNLPPRLGGLMMAGVLNVNSPRPFNIGIKGNDRNLDDVGTDRPNYDGPVVPVEWRRPGSSRDSLLVERFSLPLMGQTGNLRRNAGRGPWQHTLSLRLSKVFRFSEDIKLTPMIEMLNPLNATVFSFGAEFVDYTASGAGSFLTPVRSLKPRTVRLGLRMEF